MNATLEDISVLFEQSGGSWFVGPGSRKRIARIIANREATEAQGSHEKDTTAGTIEFIENADSGV